MRLLQAVLRLFGLLSLTCLLFACGGGGGNGGFGTNDTGGAEDAGGTEESGGTEDRNTVPAAASGYLYYGDGNKIIRHDIATGEMRWHVNTNFQFSESVTVSDDASLYGVFDFSMETFDIYAADSSLLLRVEEKGNREFRAPIQFSPNNKLFMVYREHDYDPDEIHRLEIHDFNGPKAYINEFVTGWDWISNEEILFSIGDTIYRLQISPEGNVVGEPQGVYQFGGQSVWDLSISPDGSQVAVVLKGATVHVMDVNGGGDRHVASVFTDPDGVIEDISSVRWSPDGSHLMVGTRGIKFWAYGRRCSNISILPTNADSVLDIGDKQYWLVESRDGGTFYTCALDTYAFSWLPN